MNIIYQTASDFLTNDIWVMPTDRKNILELDESGEIKIFNNIPVLRVLATPSLKKTISRLVYTIKDKMVLFKNKDENINLNIFKYLDKMYFKTPNKNYYRTKKAWYRFIGDLFEDINNWNFKKVITKTIILLKILKPVLVFDVHNVSKWNHIEGFKKFINTLHKHNISIVIRCPVESINHIKKTFENSKINNIAVMKYYGKLKGYNISTKVAEYLLKISNGNINILKLILPHSKRDLKTLRDLKIPWLKIIPLIVPKKYKRIMEIVCSMKKFSISNIEKYINLKIPTIYAYLSDLVDMKLLKKRRIGRNLIYKLNLNKDELFYFINNIPYKDLHYSVFLDSQSIHNGFRLFG
ncbi:helix-turn-helix domain-containing protein [Methanothermococcus sp. Ax23]|uniref:transcriptional regulator n=1 Tax=Methanothermococcus sp. Ax23 TaxID=3156486 RepID=UPI003B9F0E7D